MPRLALAALLAALMVFPAEARAGAHFGLGLGLGAVRSECEIAKQTGKLACFSGARGEVLFSFFHKGEGSGATKKGKDAEEDGGKGGEGGASLADDQGSGSGWWLRGLDIGTGNDWRAALAVLVVVVLLFGIYWAVLAVASRKLKLGLYYSQDFQQDRWAGTNDHDYSRYSVARAGLQAGFYLIPHADLQVHVGAGPAWARIDTMASGETDVYHLEGISTKAGIGWVPAARSGPYVLYEFEGTFFSRTSVAKYVQDNATKVPTVRRTGALMLGWTFAF